MCYFPHLVHSACSGPSGEGLDAFDLRLAKHGKKSVDFIPEFSQTPRFI